MSPQAAAVHLVLVRIWPVWDTAERIGIMAGVAGYETPRALDELRRLRLAETRGGQWRADRAVLASG